MMICESTEDLLLHTAVFSMKPGVLSMPSLSRGKVLHRGGRNDPRPRPTHIKLLRAQFYCGSRGASIKISLNQLQVAPLTS